MFPHSFVCRHWNGVVIRLFVVPRFVKLYGANVNDLSGLKYLFNKT